MKQYDVYLMPNAVKDLNDIYEYIVEKSGLPEVAWTYIEKLHGKCHDFRTAPKRGQRRDDLRKNLRIVAIDKSAVAAFEIDENRKSVTILNIFYGGIDYETIMHDRDESVR